MNFEGLITFDQMTPHATPRALKEFLEKTEDHSARQLFNLLPAPSAKAFPPDSFSSEVQPSGELMKLSFGADELIRKLQSHASLEQESSSKSSVEAKKIVEELNALLWGYTEVLERCAVELFHGVYRVSIIQWQDSFCKTVQALSDLLHEAIDELASTIRKLEKPLEKFSRKFAGGSKGWLGWLSFFEDAIDPQIQSNLKQTSKYLKNQWKAFSCLFHDSRSLIAKAVASNQELKRFPVLLTLDPVDQNFYADAICILKILEIDDGPNPRVSHLASAALHAIASTEEAILFFGGYLNEIKRNLFDLSLQWKTISNNDGAMNETLQLLRERVKNNQYEVQELLWTMSHYRAFILKNDPDPYISSRWGFTETIVGQEPPAAKEIVEMIYSAEEVHRWEMQFSASLGRSLAAQAKLEEEAGQEIEKILHAMRQPIISRSDMRKNVEKLLKELTKCDEMGSPALSTIDFFGTILEKVVQADWQYKLLQELSSYQQLYRIHEGLLGY